MADRRTRYSKRQAATRQNADKQVQKDTVFEMIQAAITAQNTIRPKPRQPRGARLKTILKYLHDHYNIGNIPSTERCVATVLKDGVKTGLFRKGILGFYRLGDVPLTKKKSNHVGDTKDETRPQQKWARIRLNKQGSVVKPKRTKGNERGLLRQQRRVNYSVYMSSSETDEDSDSSLTNMIGNVDNSPYVKNKEYVNKERQLRKMFYPDFFRMHGTTHNVDSDSDPELYCPPYPYAVWKNISVPSRGGPASPAGSGSNRSPSGSPSRSGSPTSSITFHSRSSSRSRSRSGSRSRSRSGSLSGSRSRSCSGSRSRSRSGSRSRSRSGSRSRSCSRSRSATRSRSGSPPVPQLCRFGSPSSIVSSRNASVTPRLLSHSHSSE